MNDVDFAFAAAFAAHQNRDLASAERMYRGILEKFPSHGPSLCNLGVILVGAGKLDEAASCYRLALAATPNSPDANFNLANLFRRVGKFDDAATHYRECLRVQPAHSPAWFNLGLTYYSLGNLADSVDCFRKTVEIEPGNADAQGRLGDALVRMGRVEEGIARLRRTVEMLPNEPRWAYNFGLALAGASQHEEAQAVLNNALRLKPDYAEAHNALALNLEGQGKKDDAMFHYREAVRLKPDFADAWSNMGTNLNEQGRTVEGIRCLRESITHRPASPVHSNLLLALNYSSALTQEEIRAEHVQWAEKYASPVPDSPAPWEPHDPNRRLRIGYVSSDFRTHTVAGFIEILLKHHDRKETEIFAYANVNRPDETTAKLKGLADQWRPIEGQSDRRVFELIHNDKIDVLIDLGGHTAGNRLSVLAARPSSIQATLFGYPNTTGMKAVDFRITDPISDPPGSERNYVEKLLSLPENAWVYAPPASAPDVKPERGEPFTFGCLNNAAKISDACLEAWAKVLQAVPGSKLFLLAGQSQEGAKRLRERFRKAGILRTRVETLFRLARDKYFEEYQHFDIVLDPFPYNGGVTTGDAIWMGVPVLTVAGSTYVSRQGAMINARLGLEEFTAHTPDELPERAAYWAKNRGRLAEIRAGLRERLRQSSMADGPRYVRNLEKALREAWQARLPKR